MEDVRMVNLDFSQITGVGKRLTPVFFTVERYFDKSIEAIFEAENNSDVMTLLREIDESKQELMMDLINKTRLKLARELAQELAE